ncbi:MAG: hypothetical protein OEU86_01335, partial [Gammaproteobacteria bacterium]|nr:hypothetical protein [Gammaproteobacteria bacterium]
MPASVPDNPAADNPAADNLERFNPALVNDRLPLPTAAGDLQRWGKAYGCARALAIAELSEQTDRGLFILTTTIAEAESLAREIDFFSHEDAPAVELFPDLEVLSYDAFSPHQDLIARRLTALRHLSQNTGHIVITAAPALLPRLPPAEFLRARGLALSVGLAMDQESFRSQLEDAGYQRVSQVAEPGDYA